MSDIQVPAVGSLWRDKPRRADGRVVEVLSLWRGIETGPRVTVYVTDREASGWDRQRKTARQFMETPRFLKTFEPVETPKEAP